MSDSRIKILLVDDDPIQIDLLQIYLNNSNYRLYVASSGYEALDICTSITPDLILLDVMMPVMDGIETCRKLKRMPSLSATPVIMLTAKTDRDSIHQSFETGASDFLNKPVNEIILNKRIEYCLRSCQQYKKLKSRERDLFEAQNIARLGTIKIYIEDKSIVISTNSHNLLGYDTNEKKLTFTEYMEHVHHDDKEHVEFTLDNAISDESHYMLEYRFMTDNDEIIIYQQGQFIEDSSDNKSSYLIGSIQDVTEARSTKESLDYSRYYDELTDLTNRSFFESQIKHILKHPPEDELFAVVFIGIDNLSHVNDAVGHQGGDFTLKEISNRLLQFEKRGFVISRFGGDVFSILIQSIHHIDECSRIMGKFLETIRTPVVFEDNELYITASIGVSVFPLESENVEQLLIGAEAAMMLSSENGGDCYTYRTYQMNKQTQKRLTLLKELRIAVDNNDFTIYYQPQFDSEKMKIVGMEALVRWIHKERGLISPADFIPIAEESGLIIPIGNFVLEQACTQTKKWLDMGFDLTVGVNISAQQFDDIDFITTINNTLIETGLPPNCLEVEITESMAMKDHQQTINMLTKLRDLGVSTSMDDFGTGYSSLSQLQILPLDTLKVDQTFVRCIKLAQEEDCECYENSAIANAIIVMSHNLGLKVVAEGVETKDQCDFLQQQKIEMLQGFLFSKPVPSNAFEAKLLDQKLQDESPDPPQKLLSNTL